MRRVFDRKFEIFDIFEIENGDFEVYLGKKGFIRRVELRILYREIEMRWGFYY